MFKAVLICGNTLFLSGLHEWTLSMKQQVRQVRILRSNCTISKNKLFKSEQFQLVCLFLWLNMSCVTTFYSNGLSRWNILIFLCVLMGRSLPSATKLACCVTSLQRTHTNPFSELHSHGWWYGGQIITQITCYCSSFITSLILKELSEASCWGQEHWEEQGGAAPTARTPWEAIAEHVRCSSLWWHFTQCCTDRNNCPKHQPEESGWVSACT